MAKVAMKFEKDGNGNVMFIGSLIEGEYIVNENVSNVLSDALISKKTKKGEASNIIREDAIILRRNGNIVIIPYIVLFEYTSDSDVYDNIEYKIGLFSPKISHNNTWKYCIIVNDKYAYSITHEDALHYMLDVESGKEYAYNLCMNNEH